MDLLTDVIQTSRHFKKSWKDLALAIGIEKNDIYIISKEEDPEHELILAVTKKIWEQLYKSAGLELQSTLRIAEISSISKLAAVLSNCNIEQCTAERKPFQVVDEISEKVSQWKMFGRILGLEKTFLRKLAEEHSRCEERNIEIMKTFSAPLPPENSWKLWRYYLAQFSNGREVIEEIEKTRVELLVEASSTAHFTSTKDGIYVGHPYESNNSSESIKKSDSSICVRLCSKNIVINDYQTFKEWLVTQKRYIDTFTILKDMKVINFSEGTDSLCPILETLKAFLESTNDPGFVVKGFHFANHLRLFKDGVYCKDSFDENYFCIFVNIKLALFITKSTQGLAKAMNQSSRIIKIANTLFPEMRTQNITQVNVIIRKVGVTEKMPCEECIKNNLYTAEETFLDQKLLKSWLNEIENRLKIFSITTTPGGFKELCLKLKEDMITYEALETNMFPSFSYLPEDQMVELKTLVALSPTQFDVLHSKFKHMLLLGSYGSGKSLILLKKMENLVASISKKELVYLICNDQQSEYIHFMKHAMSRYSLNNIIFCKSNDLIDCKLSRPKLSKILKHILNAWPNKTVHVFIDEFNGSYFNEAEVNILKELLLTHFKDSMIYIAVQSMEEFSVCASDESNQDLGYKYQLLANKTSFVYKYLDYSLRCSQEINDFVKLTSNIFESTTIKTQPIDIYRHIDKNVHIDNELARENFSHSGNEISTTKFSYNQDGKCGHSVRAGNVDVVYIDKEKGFDGSNILSAYCAILNSLLSNISEGNKYVICSYNEDIYNGVYYYLSKFASFEWTSDIREFIQPESTFQVYLGDYGSIRGYEFPNMIFLSPFSKKYLKYRAIECFTRATTKLILIMDNVISDDPIIDLILKEWKKMKFVDFFDCQSTFPKLPCEIIMTKNVNECIINCPIIATKVFKSKKYQWESKLFGVEKIQEKEQFTVDDVLIGLRSVCRMDNISLFSYFCETHDIGCDLFRDINENTLIHIAAAFDAPKILHFLTSKYHLELNTINLESLAPIHIASRNGSSKALAFLLSCQVEINIQDDFGHTALHRAAFNGHLKTIVLLIEKGANINIKDSFGHTPLHDAAIAGHEKVVKTLIKYGADIHAKNNDGCTPFFQAVRGGHVQILDTLITSNTDINSKNNDFNTPLHIAVNNNEDDIITFLLKKKADIYAPNINRGLPFHLPCLRGPVENVQRLIQKQEDIRIKTTSMETALHLAARNGDISVMQYIMENNVEVNSRDVFMSTALHHASSCGKNDAVKLLINNGANIRIKNSNDRTPLHDAAVCGHVEIAQILVKNGAAMNGRDKQGYTPLHFAAENGRLELVKYFIFQKAKLTMKDKYGRTAARLASSYGFEHISNELSKHRNKRIKKPFLYKLSFHH